MANGNDLELRKLDLERQSLDLERDKLKQAKSDARLRLVGSVVIGGLVSGAIALYGIRSEQLQSERARTAQLAENRRSEANREAANQRALQNRRSETLIQLVSTRERSVTDLRARMFENLLQHYLSGEEVITRITILKMLGLNFKDAVHIKPLFEMLDKELHDAPASREELRKAAQLIAKDQIEQIRQARAGAVCKLELSLGQPRQPSCMPLLRVQLIEVTKDRVRLRTSSGTGSEEAEDQGVVFGVGFFDMPMIDYTSVSVGWAEPWKYSIVLNSISDDQQGAKLTIAVLPADSYSTQHKYKFDEMLFDFFEQVPEPPAARDAATLAPVSLPAP